LLRVNKISIMDIKIGTSSIHPEDPTKTKEKIQEAMDRDKKTTTVTLGLRICGMKVVAIRI
jgi:hypothetical protein